MSKGTLHACMRRILWRMNIIEPRGRDGMKKAMKKWRWKNDEWNANYAEKSWMDDECDSIY